MKNELLCIQEKLTIVGSRGIFKTKTTCIQDTVALGAWIDVDRRYSERSDPLIISVGNREITIKVQEQPRPEIAERVYRQLLKEREVERDRDAAYARLLFGQGIHIN